MAYVMQYQLFNGEWESVTGDDEERPELYPCKKSAQLALDEHIKEALHDVKLGNLEDFDPKEWRIKEITA